MEILLKHSMSVSDGMRFSVSVHATPDNAIENLNYSRAMPCYRTLYMIFLQVQEKNKNDIVISSDLW